MPCYQAPSQPPSGNFPVNTTGFATEAECLEACREGACCNGTTCSVKPQCQCNAEAGEVFKGVGEACSPNPCLICGCATERPSMAFLELPGFDFKYRGTVPSLGDLGRPFVPPPMDDQSDQINSYIQGLKLPLPPVSESLNPPYSFRFLPCRPIPIDSCSCSQSFYTPGNLPEWSPMFSMSCSGISRGAAGGLNGFWELQAASQCPLEQFPGYAQFNLEIRFVVGAQDLQSDLSVCDFEAAKSLEILWPIKTRPFFDEFLFPNVVVEIGALGFSTSLYSSDSGSIKLTFPPNPLP